MESIFIDVVCPICGSRERWVRTHDDDSTAEYVCIVCGAAYSDFEYADDVDDDEDWGAYI